LGQRKDWHNYRDQKIIPLPLGKYCLHLRGAKNTHKIEPFNGRKEETIKLMTSGGKGSILTISGQTVTELNGFSDDSKVDTPPIRFPFGGD
jgi:hypothetical protein